MTTRCTRSTGRRSGKPTTATPNDGSSSPWAAGRGHALYAAAKAGKSYVALYLAVCVAIGRDLYGRPAERAHVLYVDAEMTPDDVRERLEAFGLGPDSDLSHLHYLSLPTIPPLDTPHGSQALVERAVAVDARHVIFDTMARAVIGGENDSDTYRAFYRHTGHAPQARRHRIHPPRPRRQGPRARPTRVEWEGRRRRRRHPARAPRGRRPPQGCTHRRMAWMPEKVDLTISEDDEDGTVTIRVAAGPSWPAGTAACAQLLDEPRATDRREGPGRRARPARRETQGPRQRDLRRRPLPPRPRSGPRMIPVEAPENAARPFGQRALESAGQRLGPRPQTPLETEAAAVRAAGGSAPRVTAAGFPRPYRGRGSGADHLGRGVLPPRPPFPCTPEKP